MPQIPQPKADGVGEIESAKINIGKYALIF